MTTKNFNAKKMFMSTLAAVVFSFVFTTSADASTTPLGEAARRIEAHKCCVEASKCIEAHKCSTEKKQEQKQEQKQEKPNILSFILQKFGVRVK